MTEEPPNVEETLGLGAPGSQDPRIFCFEEPEHDKAFEISVAKLIATLQDRERAAFISPQNILRMNHGQNWVHSAREPEPDTALHTISSAWSIPFRDIAENDLDLIGRALLPVSEDMSRQFAENMYRVVGDAAERVGNVVDGKETGSMAASLIAIFSKIEFGVDRDGNVSLPQLHVGAEAYEKLVDAMNNMEPEVAAELERLKMERTQEALDREALRRAKFARSIA